MINKKKTIGIEAFSLGETTGVGVYCTNLVANLAIIDKKNQYYIFVKRKSSIKYPSNFKEIIIDLPRLLNPFLLYFYVPFISRKYKLDIIHYTKGVSSIVNFCKTITTIHDLTPVIYPKSNKNFLYSLYWKFSLWSSVKRSNYLITISNYSKRTVVDYYKIDSSKIKVVYLGCDFNNFKKISSSDKNLDFVKEKYHLPERYILFVGNLRDSKNIKIVLQAIDKLKKKGKTINFVIAGSKRWRNMDFNSAFKQLENKELVHFIGRVDYNELPYLYGLASVFVFPSLYEGFGLPVIEAQACGCAVVTSNRTSLPEVTGDQSVTFDPYDLDSFIAVLLNILENHKFKKEAIDLGLKNVKRFQWENTVIETKNVYEEIISKN
jgi:glycosyltransferase involved in cell wall biosynthesis